MTNSPKSGSVARLAELPELDQDFIQKVKRETQTEIRCARNQLDFMAKAQSQIELLELDGGTSTERSELEAERDQRSRNAKAHAQVATAGLFDAYADQCWYLIRPDSGKLSELLPTIRSEVLKEIVCPEVASTIEDTLREKCIEWAERTAREGAVTDSARWRELRAKFLSLENQEKEMFRGAPKDHRLYAHVTYNGSSTETRLWRLMESTETLRADFELNATDAGIALGAPDMTDAFTFFLHRLFLDLLENDSRHLFAATKENGGMILGLFEASRTYCTRLARVARENERLRKARMNALPPAGIAPRAIPDQSAEAVQRIADGRRQAESILKKSLSVIEDTDDIEPYLPAFRSFAIAFFDSEAEELLITSEDPDEYKRILEQEVSARIIEGILPDRSLQAARANRTDEVRRLSIEQDMGSQVLYEVETDGKRVPAREQIQAENSQHGDWERFMPPHIRFFIRSRDNSAVREELGQVLQRRVFYWVGRFPSEQERVGKTPTTRSFKPEAKKVPEAEFTDAGDNEGVQIAGLIAERVPTVGDIEAAPCDSAKMAPDSAQERTDDTSSRAEDIAFVQKPIATKAEYETDPPALLVDAFLRRCNQETVVGFKVIKKHIWLAAGHAHARQFQYWQEGNPKATSEDNRNFRRILSLSPPEFFALLEKKRIGPASS